mgnify:CR=1 FL=1
MEQQHHTARQGAESMSPNNILVMIHNEERASMGGIVAEKQLTLTGLRNGLNKRSAEAHSRLMNHQHNQTANDK